VVLKDVSAEAAAKAGYSEKLEAKPERGRTTEEKSRRCSPYHADGDPADLKGVDFVVEAVFESQTSSTGFPGDRGHRRAQRAARFQHLHAADHRSGDRGQAQEDFIGIHFFSPVDKMPWWRYQGREDF